MKSCITINLKKDNIVIKINEDFSQEDIMYSLRKKIPELKKLYQSEKTPIVITGKVLKNREIDEIQELIKKNIRTTRNNKNILQRNSNIRNKIS